MLGSYDKSTYVGRRLPQPVLRYGTTYGARRATWSEPPKQTPGQPPVKTPWGQRKSLPRPVFSPSAIRWGL